MYNAASYFVHFCRYKGGCGGAGAAGEGFSFHAAFEGADFNAVFAGYLYEVYVCSLGIYGGAADFWGFLHDVDGVYVVDEDYGVGYACVAGEDVVVSDFMHFGGDCFSHVYGCHEVAVVVVAAADFQDSCFGFYEEGFCLGVFIVEGVFCKASYAVAAHFGFAAVGLEECHFYGCCGGFADEEDAVCADAEFAVAVEYCKFGFHVVGDDFCVHFVYEDEVVSVSVEFGKGYFHILYYSSFIGLKGCRVFGFVCFCRMGNE